jgi:hypothetical protein
MFGFSAIVFAVIASVTVILSWLQPSPEQVRLREARRQLRASGRRYPKNSPEESRALRVILEGDSLAEL